MVLEETLSVGSVLGGFKIEKELGRGGMGVVYKAHELSLNRKVALKVLAPRLSSDEEFIKRFKREAMVVAALDHPNIVKILSYGQAGGVHYFAMEYVKAQDLGQILKEKGAISLEEALSITAQVASALEEASQRGVVHRDLKPPNIMVDELGRVRVTDFGIACFQDSDTKLTRVGTFLGTPEYASPEQVSGQALDVRSDIYALGAVLYRMVSGQCAVTGDSPLAMVAKILTEPVTPIQEVNPSLPEPVCRLIDRMMAKDPAKRFQSPRELLSVLDDCMTQLKIVAPLARTRVVELKSPPPPPAVRRAPRARLWGAVAGVALAVLLTVWLVDAVLLKKKDETASIQEQGPAVVKEEQAALLPTPPATNAPDKDLVQANHMEGRLPRRPPVTDAPDEAPVQEKEEVSGAVAGPQGTAPPEKNDATPPEPAAPGAEGRKTAEEVVTSVTGDRKPPPDIAHRAAETAKKAVEAKPPVDTEMKDPARPPVVASAKPVGLPKVPTVLLAVSGDEATAPFVRANLESLMLESELQVSMVSEIPVLSEKMQFGRVPLSRYEIQRLVPKGKAHILVLAQVQRAGSMPLKYHGYTQELISATFSIQTVDLDTGLSATAPATGTVKYTALNMEESFQKEIGSKAGDMGARIRDYWDKKLGAVKAD
jgi:serine/threonine protein kinase